MESWKIWHKKNDVVHYGGAYFVHSLMCRFSYQANFAINSYMPLIHIKMASFFYFCYFCVKKSSQFSLFPSPVHRLYFHLRRSDERQRPAPLVQSESRGRARLLPLAPPLASLVRGWRHRCHRPQYHLQRAGKRGRGSLLCGQSAPPTAPSCRLLSGVEDCEFKSQSRQFFIYIFFISYVRQFCTNGLRSMLTIVNSWPKSEVPIVSFLTHMMRDTPRDG